MGRHFAAAVPGERATQLCRQLANFLCERLGDRGGVLAVDLNEHHVARMAFDQCGDLGTGAAHEQVAFPVAWHGAILDFGRTLVNRDALYDGGLC